MSKMCELCGENVGVRNSSFVFGDDGEGVWICLPCEQEEGEEEEFRRGTQGDFQQSELAAKGE